MSTCNCNPCYSYSFAFSHCHPYFIHNLFNFFLYLYNISCFPRFSFYSSISVLYCTRHHCILSIKSPTPSLLILLEVHVKVVYQSTTVTHCSHRAINMLLYPVGSSVCGYRGSTSHIHRYFEQDNVGINVVLLHTVAR